jgi:hypothetical protein
LVAGFIAKKEGRKNTFGRAGVSGNQKDTRFGHGGSFVKRGKTQFFPEQLG